MAALRCIYFESIKSTYSNITYEQFLAKTSLYKTEEGLYENLLSRYREYDKYSISYSEIPTIATERQDLIQKKATLELKLYKDRFTTNQTRFEKQFLELINKQDYYMFILIPSQEETFQNHLNIYNIKENVLHISDKWAVNANYPENGGRLKWVIMHFPNGWTKNA